MRHLDYTIVGVKVAAAAAAVAAVVAVTLTPFYSGPGGGACSQANLLRGKPNLPGPVTELKYTSDTIGI